MADKKTEIEASPIANIAIGYIETFPEDELDRIVDLSKRIGNSGITAQLFGIVERIKAKLEISETEVVSLGFMMMLAQSMVEDQTAHLDA